MIDLIIPPAQFDADPVPGNFTAEAGWRLAVLRRAATQRLHTIGGRFRFGMAPKRGMAPHVGGC